ncbi:MAG TPA: SGNH/GDSL hydrolase family protein [Thermoanaerobaculia bacterium]|nr:SGNH/GDSL hydrolase family protein [Thermoanaerobaculia bacterium]
MRTTKRNQSFARLAALLIVVSMIALPGFAASRGSANFTTLVAIGDSYGAGFESNSLNERHQAYSWPAILARQVGLPLCTPTSTVTDVCFAQPLVSYPGIGPEMVLVDLKPTIGLAGGGTAQGAPIMSTFGRAYNNVSIPGANVADVTTIKGNEAQPTRGVEQLARFILRGQATEVDSVLSLHPTFIAIWIGGNDFLGSVTAGTPKLLTPTAAFRTAYNAMLDRLIAGAPSAGMVVGTLPTNPAAVPFLTTVPPVLVDSTTRQPILVGGKPFFFISDLGDGTVGQLPPGSFVLLSALSKIQSGFGLPGVAPFNALPNAGKPLSDNDTITPAEMTTMLARVNEYNGVINEAAAARNIPVADIKGLFDTFASGKLFVGPFNLTSSYITGGLFSLDGVHLTDIGYTLFANEYIKAINRGYDAGIPLASLTTLFQDNGAHFGGFDSAQVQDTSNLVVTPEASVSMLRILQPVQQKRLRAVGH